MDNRYMIERLKKVGIAFEPGMSKDELDRTELFFQFRFPKEIREFLTWGMPVGSCFFNYRGHTKQNLERFHKFQLSIEQSFRFDLEYNREDMAAMFGQRLGIDDNDAFLDDAVISYLNQSVKLIPFYAHRCFFDGMDDMPIISFWQAVDSIFYGGTFENYLECEFLNGQRVLDNISDRMKHTGIWRDVIC